MQFEVRTLKADASGSQMVSLMINAINEADLRTQLVARSIRPVSVKPVGVGGLMHWGARDPGFSVLLFSQELLALVQAGLSIVDALEALAEQAASPRYQSVIGALRRSVSQGNPLSRALEEAGAVFPPLYVGLVRAAETTSNLPRALSRFIDYQTRMEGVRGRLVTSAIYPAILLCAGTAVSVFLMIFVVPRFAGVYQSSGRDLPWMSALLLQWGHWVTRNTGIIAGAMAVLAGAGVWTALWLRRRGGIAAMLVRVPALGPRVRTYALSRLYMTLGMLLEGGIAIVPALALARETLFGVQRDALDAAARQVRAGGRLSSAFLDHDLSAPIAQRFLRVGESSGNLGEMLIRSAEYYDAETGRWIERFTRVFEPLLMAAIGLVVGLIVVLLYMPIFDLTGSLQ